MSPFFESPCELFYKTTSLYIAIRSNLYRNLIYEESWIAVCSPIGGFSLKINFFIIKRCAENNWKGLVM